MNFSLAAVCFYYSPSEFFIFLFFFVWKSFLYVPVLNEVFGGKIIELLMNDEI